MPSCPFYPSQYHASGGSPEVSSKKGIYQHCGEQHLHRYLAEFEFRYNHRVANGTDDLARANLALAGIVGKRLTYARPEISAEA